MKNGNLIVKVLDGEGVDDYHRRKSINTMSSDFGSFNLSHSKRLMIEVDNQIGGFCNISICYGDTDEKYFHKKHLSSLVNNGFVSKSFG